MLIQYKISTDQHLNQEEVGMQHILVLSVVLTITSVPLTKSSIYCIPTSPSLKYVRHTEFMLIIYRTDTDLPLKYISSILDSSSNRITSFETRFHRISIYIEILDMWHGHLALLKLM